MIEGEYFISNGKEEEHGRWVSVETANGVLVEMEPVDLAQREANRNMVEDKRNQYRQEDQLKIAELRQQINEKKNDSH